MQNVNLFGHDYILENILKMLHANNLHNSIIFSGKKGVGKYSYIIKLAKFLLSHDINSFKNINNFIIDEKISNLVDNNSCRDLLLITPEFDEKKQTFKDIISIDAVRKITDFLKKTGTDNRYKIVIIDSVDNLNVNASNALLKNLEEPSKNTLFFLISHSYNTLLDTIKSRCINIKFKNLTNIEMLNILQSYNISYPKDNINNLISLANGSYSNLLWYLESNNFEIYLDILKFFKENINNTKVYNFVNKIKLKENISYNMIFNIIENSLISNINSNNIEEFNSLIEEIQNLSKISENLYLDKPTVLLNILFKAKCIN